MGPAFRVPLIVVSPWAPANSVFKGTLDHTSILQFIERTFSTPARPITLSTIDSRRRGLADLTKAFDFRQQPNSSLLPSAAQLFPSGNRTILTLNLQRTTGRLLDQRAELAGAAARCRNGLRQAFWVRICAPAGFVAAPARTHARPPRRGAVDRSLYGAAMVQENVVTPGRRCLGKRFGRG